MSTSDKQVFVTAVEKQHGQNLRRYLASRLRNAAADLPDLVQEVFLRLLRVEQHETIRNPQAYLITIASHVLHQHALRQAANPEPTEMLDALFEMQSAVEDPAMQLETQQRVAQLEQAMRQLSPKARSVLVLHRRDGFSLEEIASHLGMSRGMAKKYLAQALSHCRQRMPAQE
ncbi:RNA polymerase sigma factor [Peristeroidobacter soli]|uniref:RNA polymerase sigma factor n=1 Tax=Peristeroidobacter soli TaxID=2497877 RepID=UPI001300BC1C|nr:RNA polymerase sigma factor [Peristeroidobacter soli]